MLALLMALAAAHNPAARPDISLTASFTAKEIVFETVPNVTVTFSGDPRNVNVWHSDRTNLPDQVQPHVIYRDAGIRLVITSTLPDIEQIIDEALGPADTPTEREGGKQ